MIELLKIRENENIAKQAANWFHKKWGIPLSAYQESICECLKNENVVPQWYLAMDNNVIVGGFGVIENDFHNRKDLTPNVCAVYVDEGYRCQGIAGKLLQYVCDGYYSQPIKFEDFWHVLCQKYEFFSAILHDFILKSCKMCAFQRW